MKGIGTELGIKAATVAAAIGTLSLLLLLGFWLLYPYDPITVSPQPERVVYPPNRIVKQGGRITIRFHFVRRTDVVPDIYRQFRDDLVFAINNDEANTPAVVGIGEGWAEKEIPVPMTLPPGVYSLHSDGYYQMNPIRSVHTQSVTETFTVIPSGDTDLDPKN